MGCNSKYQALKVEEILSWGTSSILSAPVVYAGRWDESGEREEDTKSWQFPVLCFDRVGLSCKLVLHSCTGFLPWSRPCLGSQLSSLLHLALGHSEGFGGLEVGQCLVAGRGWGMPWNPETISAAWHWELLPKGGPMWPSTAQGGFHLQHIWGKNTVFQGQGCPSCRVNPHQGTWVPWPPLCPMLPHQTVPSPSYPISDGFPCPSLCPAFPLQSSRTGGRSKKSSSF